MVWKNSAYKRKLKIYCTILVPHIGNSSTVCFTHKHNRGMLYSVIFFKKIYVSREWKKSGSKMTNSYSIQKTKSSALPGEQQSITKAWKTPKQHPMNDAKKRRCDVLVLYCYKYWDDDYCLENSYYSERNILPRIG